MCRQSEVLLVGRISLQAKALLSSLDNSLAHQSIFGYFVSDSSLLSEFADASLTPSEVSGEHVTVSAEFGQAGFSFRLLKKRVTREERRGNKRM